MRITEDASENRRRSRRRAYPDADHVSAGPAGPAKTRRTVLTWLAACRARDRLEAGPGYDYAYLLRPKPGALRKTILAELHRLDDDAALRGVARRICDHRLPTAEAVALIRRARLGRDPAPPDRLADAILATVDAHLARYPATPQSAVVDALREATLAVAHRDG
jgi:hypothetical protein